MGLVGMRTDEELILSLCPAHRRFITDTICFFRRNLPGQERLSDLKEQCPARYGPACLCMVLTFYQKKLGGSRVLIAEIGRYGSQLFRVQAIGETILHRLNCTFSRRCFIRADVGGRRKNPSFRQTVFLLWDTLSRSASRPGRLFRASPKSRAAGLGSSASGFRMRLGLRAWFIRFSLHS